MNLSALKQKFPQLLFEENEVLAPYTYMKVGGVADALVDVRSKDDLFSLSAYCFQEKIPFLVLGGGSNVVIPDEGLKKLVIHNLTSNITFKVRNETLTEVQADSGVITAVLAAKAIERELTGFEYFVGVPGTIGGAVVNNSHFSLKDLVGDNLLSVEVCTIQGQREIWSVEKLKFDYDHSVFQERPDVVLSATFLLKKAELAMISEHVKKAALKRTRTQPIGIPSSGCMYRNPILSHSQFSSLNSKLMIPEGAYHLRADDRYQVAAGFLIDKAGLKGTRVGGVEVSTKHATYMLNSGHAAAKDIEILCRKVESTVKKKFNIFLEREVFFLK